MVIFHRFWQMLLFIVISHLAIVNFSCFYFPEIRRAWRLLTTFTMDSWITEIALYLVCLYPTSMCFTMAQYCSFKTFKYIHMGFSVILYHFPIAPFCSPILAFLLFLEHIKRVPISGPFTLVVPFANTSFFPTYQ